MRLSYLVRGFPGHPLHPPLTDATIGAYTVSAALGVLAALGVNEPNLAKGWWLALIVGLIVSAPTALTGLADWLSITWRTPLTLGGWFGGTIVFVHGMRVLNLVEEPPERAVTPGHPEKAQAEA